MRIALLCCSVAIALVACKTTSTYPPPSSGAPWVCNPCPQPCTAYPGCGQSGAKTDSQVTPTPTAPPMGNPDAGVAMAADAGSALTAADAGTPADAGVVAKKAMEPAAEAQFSPAPGTFEKPQSVTVTSSTPDAVLHCTMDGSEPTADSPTCGNPVDVSKTTTLKAIATAPGAAPSKVASGDYEIKPAPKAVVSDTKIELKEKVQFESGKAIVRPESSALLDEVAKIMNDHPEIAKVVVEGHTDNSGNAAANQKLSQARAAAVRQELIKRGIDAKRLAAKGFGATKPIADNKTPEGRETNRRVELMIAQKK